ncbi:DUF3152 domain-containing protein [Streptomyces sp. NPDC048650]|uniref:DUF3152 domain-containing protein n=1 Tax=Streptomyces sp. NPDC048650 TaxID=3365583 RepID=UPI003719BAC3
MGRHSRRGRPETADDLSGAAVPPPSPPPPPFTDVTDPAAGPGPGRRRRQAPTGDPATEVRGGHPEQHEPGGGWGAVPPTGGPRIPRPRSAEAPAGGGRYGAGGATGPAGSGPAGGPRPGPGAGTVRGVVGGRPGGPGPRPEYVDAFEDDDVFRAGAPGRGAPGAGGHDAPGAAVPAQAPADGLPPGARFTGRSVVFDREEIHDSDRPGALGAPDAELGDEADPDVLDAADEHPSRRGAKGRTFTGAAAAAVTTVLAVVIAGQVADQHKEGDAAPPLSGADHPDGADGQASRSHARPTQDAKPASYEAQMAQVFPLDAQLTADGTFRPVGGKAEAPGHGKVLRYRVDVEDGLPLDGALFAEAVHKTLNDDRSWAHGGARTFERVASGHADFVISLASPGTTAKWCAKSGLDTSEDNVSCDSAATDRVMINAYRWAQGAKTYGHDKMFAYRQMLINHEVGHRLGHNHEVCGKQGALAPVMMQQTKFLTTDGVTCRPNSWPYPAAR